MKYCSSGTTGVRYTPKDRFYKACFIKNMEGLSCRSVLVSLSPVLISSLCVTANLITCQRLCFASLLGCSLGQQGLAVLLGAQSHSCTGHWPQLRMETPLTCSTLLTSLRLWRQGWKSIIVASLPTLP